jgi:hypothetical protein
MAARRAAKMGVGLALGAVVLGGLSAAASQPSSPQRPVEPKHAAATVSAKGVANCAVFPRNNFWNTPVIGLPKHKRSATWMSHMSPRSDLHPDFGPAYGEQPVPYGIPITVVGPDHPKVKVRFVYASESDRVRYPLGHDTLIEGGRGADGDRHAIIVDRSDCTLYETYATRRSAGKWRAGSGAVWDLDGNRLRRDGWTSADAAGLPILPGLLRLSELKAGHVRHAIRFTTDVTSMHHIWPARHDAGSRRSLDYPPMGARFRLKPSFDTRGYGHSTKVVLRAMKNYGLVLADNGSPWYFQGQSIRGWPTRMIEELKTIPGRAFYAVDTRSMKIKAGSARARQ